MKHNSDSDLSQAAVKQVFDQVAAGYDNAALRFSPFCADAMVGLLKPRPGQKILDVATGTGAVAIAMGQALRQQGRVMGIDVSDTMIGRAIANVEKMALDNVDFFVMDAQSVEFKTDYFDHTVCSFGLFFLPDMDKALRSWMRVTKTGGKILLSSFNSSAFEPMRQMFADSLQNIGVQLQQPPFYSDRMANPEICTSMLLKAGLKNVTQSKKQMGYHLNSANEWWDVLWNSDARALIDKIDPVRQAEFKIQHLSEVEKFAKKQGLWMDVEVLLSIGQI